VRGTSAEEIGKQSQPGRRTDEAGSQTAAPAISQGKGKEKSVITPEKASGSFSRAEGNVNLDREHFRQQRNNATKTPGFCYTCGKTANLHGNGKFCPKPAGNNKYQKKAPAGRVSGKAALMASVQDMSAQTKGAQDASREMAGEIATLQSTISDVSIERDQAKAKLSAHDAKQAQIDAQHSKRNEAMLQNMSCHWTDKADDGNLWFIFCWSWVLAIFRYSLYLVYPYDFDYEFDWCHVLIYLGYIVLIVLWDRRRCLRNGRQPYFYPVPTRYAYTYVKTHGGDSWKHGDERPESWKVSDNKYEAHYATFSYSEKGPRGTTFKQTNRTVSVELLVQLCSNNRVMSLANDEDVTEERMRQTASAFKCINISKYLTLDEDVVENTIAVAMGCWKRNLRRRFGHF
jgi:hypothetical protein